MNRSTMNIKIGNKYLHIKLDKHLWRFKMLSLIAVFIFYYGCTTNSKISPNIIYINVDDLGWKDLGIYGSTFYETPNIDHLASQGLLFTSAYSSASNCAPSRASLMTGLYSPRHGIYTVGNSNRGESKTRKIIPTPNTTILNDSIQTLATEFKNAGYRTISIGKWHISESPLNHGFDINIAGGHNGLPKSYFSPYQNKNLEDGPEGEYLTDRLTQEAVSFLKENKKDPFFMYLTYYTVHTPLQAKEELILKYQNKEQSGGQSHAIYAAMIESLDSGIGKILNAVNDLGLDNNTVVILTSDNGGIRSISTQEPLRAGKGSYYEGGIRVPLIIRWPGHTKEGERTEIPVINIDFYPTFMEILGIQKSNLDGQSLLPILTGMKIQPPRSLYWHFPIYLEAYDPEKDDGRDPLFRTRPGAVIRMGEWKLHQYFEDGGLELYNLIEDPGERYNQSNIHPEIRDRLLDSLNRWRVNTNAPIPKERNPEYIEIN